MVGRLSKGEKGFTLMELLIAVAILTVLAAVGVPLYSKLRVSAKHTEANANLDGIRTAEEAYKMVNGTYLACEASPRDLSQTNDWTQAVPWQDQGTGFTSIGFEPNSNVRFQYEVQTYTNDAIGPDYIAGAYGDTDGDGNFILYIATSRVGPHVVQSGEIPNGVTFASGSLTIDDTCTED